MDTDRFYQNLLRDETLIKRRPWYILAVILFVLGVFAHQPVALLAAFFLLVIGVVPELWYAWALRYLIIRQSVSPRRAFFGETITFSLSVENQKFLPLPWVEVEDELPAQLSLLNGHVSPSYKINRCTLVNAFSFWSFQRVTRSYSARCMARGVYLFGPAVVRSSDPFGWLVREERVDAHEIIVVYPLLAPVEAFGFSPLRPLGDWTAAKPFLEDPLRVAGIRAYQLGDDPRRIHWKATARAGELRSKMYEPGYQQRLLIFLNISTYLESWMGIDPEIQELTIAAAASLALWGLDEGYAVGLVANSVPSPLIRDTLSTNEASESTSMRSAPNELPYIRVPMAQNREQREQLLLACTQILPYLSMPIESLIETEGATLPLGTTVLLVSPASVLQETTMERLWSAGGQGGAVHLVLTGDAASPCDLDASPFPVHRIGGREVWYELIKNVHDDAIGQGDDRSGGRSIGFHLA